jgi:hypothetical protein
MYTERNFKTKKALKEAVANGEQVGVYSVSPFEQGPFNGRVYLEGPHYPEPHKWYAQAEVKDSIIVSVK